VTTIPKHENWCGCDCMPEKVDTYAYRSLLAHVYLYACRRCGNRWGVYVYCRHSQYAAYLNAHTGRETK
jgi:hypothetical protein